MRTALITGVHGQDGSYLAQLLLARGWQVVGAVRDPERAAMVLHGLGIAGVQLVACDLQRQDSIDAVLAAVRPQQVYNLAAFASGAGMFDDPLTLSDVNGLAVARWLEAIRRNDPSVRFCQASSSEMFGDTTVSPQAEAAPMRPRTPYGAAKQYGHAMVQIYRQRYGLFACSAILFNHESPRRGLGFVTRKISHHAALIRLGRANTVGLGSLDARRDWGFAGDHMLALAQMLDQPAPMDCVVATGQTHSVRDFCAAAFGHVGLDWRDHVRTETQDFRAPETVQLVGDASLARQRLGWAPQVGFSALVAMMVDADLARLQAAAVAA
jgi:GDPmannose 4,6-dehydratase